MRNVLKKFLVFTTAAVIAVGGASLTACGSTFEPLTGDPSAATVQSNGGFVVATGDYYYFINGVETYTSDNTYGDVVKGALMRIKKSDVEAKKNTAETVIPSLMVAGDYTSGIYIYDGRIYYATPNNVKNTSGEIENDYLDFKSAKLDGSDVKSYLRVSDNSLTYRFVEAGGDNTVYVVYVDGSDLHSYNTSDKTDTLLVKGMSAYTLNSSDKTDPWIYYTMGVTENADSDGSLTTQYNQIYRVRADATESYYEYTWDQDWLDENNDGEAPYLNYGEIVLDGIGANDNLTQFNHDADAAERPAISYTYTLQSYSNDGIYFLRSLTSTPGDSVGTSEELFYLPVSALGEGWNAISGNAKSTEGGSLDMVADSVNVANASTSAIFYIEEGVVNGEAVKHHYLYVSDQYIYRADVKADGSGKNASSDLEIAYDVSGATLISIDNGSDSKYHYVYFTCSNGSGLSMQRAVYNGEAANYANLQYEDENNAPYSPVKLLNVQHASGWYNYEIIDNVLFYANAEAFSSTSYNYIFTVNLKNADGTLRNNEELEAFNEKYNEIMDSDDGYLAKLVSDGYTNLSTAIKYYFYTGGTTLFYENIKEAVDAGKKETYLYTQEEQDSFAAFVAATGDTAGMFADGEDSYRTMDYFTVMIGAKSEDDEEAYNEYWKTAQLKAYIVTEEEEGLEAWAWALIGVAIGIVVIGAAAAVAFALLRKKKTDEAPAEEKLAVDTTDDRDVDVYGMSAEPAAEAPVAESEAAAEEPVAETAEEPAEEPVGEAAAESEGAETESDPKNE